jgi:hypothetical protein
MEEAIKNGQSRDTENIGHKTRNKVKQNRKLSTYKSGNQQTITQTDFYISIKVLRYPTKRQKNVQQYWSTTNRFSASSKIT